MAFTSNAERVLRTLRGLKWRVQATGSIRVQGTHGNGTPVQCCPITAADAVLRKRVDDKNCGPYRACNPALLKRLGLNTLEAEHIMEAADKPRHPHYAELMQLLGMVL